MMRKLLLLALLCFVPSAFAQNYTATQGAGSTFGAKLVSTVLYPQVLLCDPATPANCAVVNASGQITALIAGTVTVTGTVSANASQTGTWTVQPGNTANTTAWKVDGSAVNQPVNFTQYAGNAITCTMTAYGTAPTGNCPGFNTFVTNATPGIANNADAIAAVAAGSTSPVPVNSYNYVFNGTTWDRIRSGTQTGSVAVASSDPCLGANKTNLPISQNGTTSVQLVALSGATSIYVCSLSLIAAGATTIALTTGTGSACVTGNAAVIGTTTASIANSMSLAANGGLTLGNGAGTIAKGAASSELCMVLGTSVFVSGNLTFVQQ